MRVAIIPAKGGSQRVLRKNVKLFHGRPIMAYSIDTARRSQLFDRIIVSTDDAEVAAVARANGAEVAMRPLDLADVGTQEIGSLIVRRLCDRDRVPRHACVIYATAPLLEAEDLDTGWREMVAHTALFAYGVHEKTLADAGAFYWSEGAALLKGVPLVGSRTVMIPMPDARVCDINTPEDWALAERKYAALHPGIVDA